MILIHRHNGDRTLITKSGLHIGHVYKDSSNLWQVLIPQRVYGYRNKSKEEAIKFLLAEITSLGNELIVDTDKILKEEKGK